MLPCICSDTWDRRRRTVVRTKKAEESQASVSHSYSSKTSRRQLQCTYCQHMGFEIHGDASQISQTFQGEHIQLDQIVQDFKTIRYKS